MLTGVVAVAVPAQFLASGRERAEEGGQVALDPDVPPHDWDDDRGGRDAMCWPPTLPPTSAWVMAVSRSPREVIERAVSFFARCRSRMGEFPNHRC